MCVCALISDSCTFQRRDTYMCSKRFPPAEGLQSFQLEQFVIWRSVSHFKVNIGHHLRLPVMTLPLPVCPDVIDFLQLNVLPLLKGRLSRKMTQEAEQGAEQSSLAYLLSDIFSSDDEDGFTEVDNS